MPKQTADGQIKIDDYKSIKEDGKGFLDAWLFIILFSLLSLMTMLMQYLTIAKIYDDYNDIEESLTFERIEFINDNIQEHETILAEHEQKEAEMMAQSKREKNVQDRKFNKVGQAIVIEHKKKNVETRGKTVQRIANNQYVNTENAKAGHVVNPFGDENKRDTKIIDFHSLLQKLFRGDEENEIKTGEKLVSKPKVIDLKKMSQVKELSKVYKFLTDNGYAELRGNKGYFATVDYYSIETP